jgi:hypothetical protein
MRLINQNGETKITLLCPSLDISGFYLVGPLILGTVDEKRFLQNPVPMYQKFTNCVDKKNTYMIYDNIRRVVLFLQKGLKEMPRGASLGKNHHAVRH